METLNVEKQAHVCIIRFAGELTLEVVDKLKQEIQQHLQDPEASVLVIDLSQTVFLDSSGIGFLVHLNNRKKSFSKELYLLKPSPQVKKTLSLVKLLNHFNVIDDESGLQALLDSPPSG